MKHQQQHGQIEMSPKQNQRKNVKELLQTTEVIKQATIGQQLPL